MTLRIGLVGAGAWGRNHLRNLASLEGADLVVVVDRSAEIRKSVRAKHPNVPVFESVQEALREGLDGLVVATNAETHAEVAKAALEADVHVLVEKPLTLRGEKAAALVALAEQRSRVLMVGHLLLYHAGIRALRELVTSGELGRVHYIYAQRLNLGVVRQHENAWWSLAPHDLSVIHYITGADPAGVSARGGVFLQPERGVHDVVFGTLDYADGCLAHVHVSWLDPHKVRRITVVGDKKMAVFDDTSPDRKLTIFDKGVEPMPSAVPYSEGVRVRTGDIQIPKLKMKEPLREELMDFLHCVRTGETPVASAQSGLAVVRALEAGQRSLEREGAREALT